MPMYNIFRLWAITPPPDPWAPTQLSNLRGWWVPDGLFATGSTVASLPSTGGISNTLTQEVIGRQPAYTLLNGRGALDFDGTDDALTMSDSSIMNNANAICMFFLFKLDAIAGDATIKNFMFFQTAAGGSTRFQFGLNIASGTPKTYGFAYKNADASGTVFSWSNTFADTNPHILVASFNRAVTPTHLDIFLDGTHIHNVNTAFSSGNWDATNSTSIVGNRTSTLNSIDGKLSNFGVIRGIPTTDERQRLEGYLGWFGGIQSNLPSGHPFRNSPPVM